MAAVDYFLNFDGIKGESANATHKDEIDVESWSWGETHARPASRGEVGSSGKVSMQDFHFVMSLNKASPSSCARVRQASTSKRRRFTVRKAGKGQQDYLTFKFHDVLVSSYQTGRSEHTDLPPTDQVSFNFAKIELEYKQQKPDGSFVSAGQFKFDLKAHKTF